MEKNNIYFIDILYFFIIQLSGHRYNKYLPPINYHYIIQIYTGNI